MKRLSSLALVVCCQLLLVGCWPDENKTVRREGPITLDGYCSRPNLSSSLRQTVVVIDQSAVSAADRAAMREANPALFDLVLGLSDPQRSAATGAAAPREPITIYVVPADGSPVRLLFSGCPPNLSSAEQAELAASNSGFGNAKDAFFGDSPAQHAEEAAEQFRRSLGGVLAGLGEGAPQTRAAPVEFGLSPLVRGLQGLRNLAPPEKGVVRLFLFTDLSGFQSEYPDAIAARRAGFEEAGRLRLSLGQSEVHLVGPGATPSGAAREFADAFLLGSQGDLSSWGSVVFNALPNPPVEVRSFSGEIQSPPNTYPMQMRVGVDKNGALVASWITLRITVETATPLTGGLSCDARRVCRLTSDGGGLAQVWSVNPNPEPEYSSDMPLSGLRNLEAEIINGRITGAVFDPFVDQIGEVPGVDRLSFSLSEQ